MNVAKNIGQKLKGRTVFMALFLLFPWGCAERMTPVQLETQYGPHPPVIVKYSAAERITGGRTWRVFLAAEDPGGDMASVKFELKQPGRGYYPSYWKKLGPEMGKAFSGYFYLNTPRISPWGGKEFLFVTLTLKIKIFDKAKHASEEITLPLELVRSVTEPFRPVGFSEEEKRSLGPIMIQFPLEKNLWDPRAN